MYGCWKFFFVLDNFIDWDMNKESIEFYGFCIVGRLRVR